MAQWEQKVPKNDTKSSSIEKRLGEDQSSWILDPFVTQRGVKKAPSGVKWCPKGPKIHLSGHTQLAKFIEI
jgi:hypothetical protein